MCRERNESKIQKQIPVTLCADLTSETLQTAASALSMSLMRVEFVIELLGLVVSAKRIVLKFGYLGIRSYPQLDVPERSLTRAPRGDLVLRAKRPIHQQTQTKAGTLRNTSNRALTRRECFTI